MANIVDTVIIFRILKKLVTPWEKTKAFELGVIDKDGKVLVKGKKRTREQNAAFTTLDRLVFNLKRLLAKVPGGKTQLGSYIAALALLKEYVEQETNKPTGDALMERFEEQRICPNFKHDIATVEGYLDAMEEAMNEMTSGASFGGSLSGAGTNAQVNSSGLAGADPILQRRKRTKIEKLLKKIRKKYLGDIIFRNSILKNSFALKGLQTPDSGSSFSTKCDFAASSKK